MIISFLCQDIEWFTKSSRWFLFVFVKTLSFTTEAAVYAVRSSDGWNHHPTFSCPGGVLWIVPGKWNRGKPIEMIFIQSEFGEDMWRLLKSVVVCLDVGNAKMFFACSHRSQPWGNAGCFLQISTDMIKHMFQLCCKYRIVIHDVTRCYLFTLWWQYVPPTFHSPQKRVLKRTDFDWLHAGKFNGWGMDLGNW